MTEGARGRSSATSAVTATVHCLLHGKYMTVSRRGGGKVRPREPLKRYWRTDLWDAFFDETLNGETRLDDPPRSGTCAGCSRRTSAPRARAENQRCSCSRPSTCTRGPKGRGGKGERRNFSHSRGKTNDATTTMNDGGRDERRATRAETNKSINIFLFHASLSPRPRPLPPPPASRSVVTACADFDLDDFSDGLFRLFLFGFLRAFLRRTSGGGDGVSRRGGGGCLRADVPERWLDSFLRACTRFMTLGSPRASPRGGVCDLGLLIPANSTTFTVESPAMSWQGTASWPGLMRPSSAALLSASTSVSTPPPA